MGSVEQELWERWQSVRTYWTMRYQTKPGLGGGRVTSWSDLEASTVCMARGVPLYQDSLHLLLVLYRSRLSELLLLLANLVLTLCGHAGGKVTWWSTRLQGTSRSLTQTCSKDEDVIPDLLTPLCSQYSVLFWCNIILTVQYSIVQYSTVQYSVLFWCNIILTVQYSTVQYSTVQYSRVQYSTVQYSTLFWCNIILTVQYIAVLYIIELWCILLYFTALCCTALYYTVLYYTVLYFGILYCTLL